MINFIKKYRTECLVLGAASLILLGGIVSAVVVATEILQYYGVLP